MNTNKISWLGSKDMSLDNCTMKSCGDMTLGYFGGTSTSGAKKNEDGAFLLSGEGWNLALALDAHNSSESAELVLNEISVRYSDLEKILDLPVKQAFHELSGYIIGLFESEDFRDACKKVKGETAFLLVAQKDNYLWWFSIGDNVAYLLHPELAKLGQTALNQRQFFEWIGQVNTFDLPVPCYNTGVRELREGQNYIYLTTDGVLECGEHFFENGNRLYSVLTQEKNVADNIAKLLTKVMELKGKDSATTIGWLINNELPGQMPTASE